MSTVWKLNGPDAIGDESLWLDIGLNIGLVGLRGSDGDVLSDAPILKDSGIAGERVFE